MSRIEINTLIEQHRFIRNRLLKLLGEIEASEKVREALLWMMPFGKGRAHISWQMLHCAATLDKYLNVRILQGVAFDPELVELYGGGSASDPAAYVEPAAIREILERTTEPYYQYYLSIVPERLDDPPYQGADRTHREILYLLNWHEASHQGQCQIIWNSFRANT
jgi:hypothetical protein